MHLVDNLTRFSVSDDTVSPITVFDPALYYEIFVTDYEDIIRRQVELDNAQCEWDSLIFLHETASAVYGHVCESNTVSPAMRAYVDSMGFTEHRSFTTIGTESLNTVDGFKAGCEGLLSSIWENLKRFFKWIWEKIKGFFKAIKNFIVKMLRFLGIMSKDDKKTESIKDKIDTVTELTDITYDINLETGRVIEKKRTFNYETNKVTDTAKVIRPGSSGNESLSFGIESNDTADDITKKITETITKAIRSTYDYANEKQLWKILTVIVRHTVSMMDRFFNEKNLADLDNLRDTLANDILNDISDPDTRDMAETLFKKYDIQLEKKTIGEMLIENGGATVINGLQQFYSTLVRICKEQMELGDKFTAKADGLFAGMQIKTWKEMTGVITQQDNVELNESLLYIQKITTPASILVTKTFSAKVTILSKVMRDFYNEINKTHAILIKEDHHHDYRKYQSYIEKLLKPYEFEHFNGIAVYRDDFPGFIKVFSDPNQLAVGITWVPPFTTKYYIFVTQAFVQKCTDDSMRKWIYMHELGHVKNHDLLEQVTRGVLNKKSITQIDMNNPMKKLSIIGHNRQEYKADKHAYDEYGENISVDTLKFLANNAANENGISVDDMLDFDDKVHPTLRERIDRIMSYSQIRKNSE